MTTRITLTGNLEGFSGVKGGVKFTDGIAEVRELIGPSRDFFTMKSASIVDLAQTEGDDGAKPIDSLTVAELQNFARTQNPPIEFTKSLKRDELLTLVQTELDDRRDIMLREADAREAREQAAAAAVLEEQAAAQGNTTGE